MSVVGLSPLIKKPLVTTDVGLLGWANLVPIFVPIVAFWREKSGRPKYGTPDFITSEDQAEPTLHSGVFLVQRRTD